MTIAELQSQVDSWIKNTKVGYFDVMTNNSILSEEVGELSKILNRKYGMQIPKETDVLNLEDEIADVIWVLVCIANQTGIDITKALESNLVKKTKRDHKRFG